MTRRRQEISAVSDPDPRTIPAAVAAGDAVTLSRESAQAIADAALASGFPPPAQIQAILDAADETPATPVADETEG